MGAWNYGLFDNDGACDFLGNLIDELEEVVEEGLLLTKRQGRKLPVFRAKLAKGEILNLTHPVMPAVAAISAIASKIPYARICVKRQRVVEWKRKYLAWFDDQLCDFDEYDANELKEYRRNAQKEFNALIRKLDAD
jgi:hypothetical protein